MKTKDPINQTFINKLVKEAIKTEIAPGAFKMNATVEEFVRVNDLKGYEKKVEKAFKLFVK